MSDYRAALEAAAKVCEQVHKEHGEHPEMALTCAAAIRALPSPEAQEAIGEVRESGVYWFDQNPHAYPLGTKFYAAPAAPGWASVPVEPTKVMRLAGQKILENYPMIAGRAAVAVEVYSAMLTAAKEPK